MFNIEKNFKKNTLGSFLVFFLRIWGWGLIYVILIKKKRCIGFPFSGKIKFSSNKISGTHY